jgi:cell division protein FtsZ
MVDIVNDHVYASIKVIGVGGCGVKAVDYILNKNFYGVECVCIDADAEELKGCSAENTILVNDFFTKGVWADDSYYKGAEVVSEFKSKIKDILLGAHLVIIVAGLGGGVGTHASPVIAELAREMGVLVTAVVSMPFRFEGDDAYRNAKAGLANLYKSVRSIVEVNNQEFFDVHEGESSLQEVIRNSKSHMFELARELVVAVSSAINSPGLVNIDFEDMRVVLGQTGRAVIGAAEAFGSDRASIAAEIALDSVVAGSSGGSIMPSAILVVITASRSLTMKEVNQVMTTIKRLSENAIIIFTAVFDADYPDRLSVICLATGFGFSRTNDEGLKSAEVQAELLKEKIADSDRKILALQMKLASASGDDRDGLEQRLVHERSQREKADEKRVEVEKIVEVQEAEIARLKQDLGGRVRNSINSLKNSLVTTDENISNYRKWSFILKASALVCFVCSIIILVLLVFEAFFPSLGFKGGLVSSVKELQYLSLIFTTFPVVVFLVVGTTLLRHDTKLMCEIRIYTEQKHQIERMAGVLQSAQYAAHDLDKSKDYVEETFTIIRDSLISAPVGSRRMSKDASFEDNPDDKDEGVIPGLKMFKEVLELFKRSGVSGK